MEKEKTSIQEMKERYEKLRKEYSLPDFEKLNEDFQIEKLSEIETEHLLREIRKFISEKVSSYFKFLESILNPMNAPVFIHSIVRVLSEEGKQKINQMYGEMEMVQLELLDLDTIYKEKKEASFIKSTQEKWDIMKKEMEKIIKNIRSNWANSEDQKENNYFN